MATAQKKKPVPAGFVSANVNAEFWKPEVDGERLEGWYQGSRIQEARNGFAAGTIYDVADENGELRSVSGGALTRQFERINVGDRVLIVYHGRKASNKPGRSPMKDFEVFVKGDLKPFHRND